MERGETFVAYVYRGYWIDIGTPEKYMQVHRDIMDRRFLAEPFGAEARGLKCLGADVKVEDGASIEGPCFIDDGTVVKAGARILPYSVIGRNSVIEEDAVVDGAIIWPNGRIVARRRRAAGHPRPPLPRRPQRRDRQRGHSRRQVGGDGLFPPRGGRMSAGAAMSVNPGIFKAYDIRGIYPGELDEAVARQIGRAFVAYLGAKRIAVGRDMRVSAPSIAAAFIEGAREQGADVVDYGMIATDMLYFAVARDAHEGGAMMTASHNPKDYIGMKLVRAEAFPLSGEAGISQIRDMVSGGTIPPPAAPRGSLSANANLLDDYVAHVLRFIDPSVIKPFNVVLDAGSGMGGLVAPKLFERLPCRTTRLCFEIDGTFPNHEANPLIEENRRDMIERVIAEKADIGIAWDGDADRCFFVDRDGEFIPGDFVTALLAEAFLMQGARRRHRLRRARQLRRQGHGRAVRRPGADEPRRPRVLQEADARGERGLRRRGDRALLLPRQLLRGQRVHPRAAHPRADVDQGQGPARAARAAARQVLHLGRDQHQGQVDGARGRETRRPRGDGPARGWRDVYRMDGVSVEAPDWHFNVRASNTEPLLRLNLEATTQAVMEAKRDEVLGFIRG